MENEETKKKKPFYKKWWFIVIAVLIVISIIGMNMGNKDDVKWSSIQLGEHLPEPKKGTIRMGSDLDDYLSLTLKNVSNDYYEEYRDICIEKGYVVESEKSGNRYEAFNNEGYELNLAYYSSSKEISIILQAPEKMSEFNFPSNGIGALLPKTKSTIGKVTSDTSNTFRVKVGNTTINDYNEYVKSCEENGFNVDYHKNEKSYSAKNSDGYRLNLQYLGANVVDILIQVPENQTTSTETPKEETKPTPTETQKPTESTTTNNNGNNSSSGLSPEFKKAMDSYESFMDEYIAFMKKYSDSNGTDMSLISDYSKYVSKYAEVCKDFEKWNSKDMSKEEASYYLEVQTRVNQKLLEISY